MIAVWQRRGEGRPGIDPVDQFCRERAQPRVISSVGGYRAVLLTFGDPVEQLLQDRTVAFAAGRKFHDACEGSCIAGDRPGMVFQFELSSIFSRLETQGPRGFEGP